MALWFDAKGKSYAGDHTSSWLKAYVEQQLEQNEKQCRENLRREEEQRKAADTALQDAIDVEEKERMAAVEEESVARQAGDNKIQNALDAHQADTANPHKVTKEQVGLGNADNTADLDKPISTATRMVIDAETAAREEADTSLQSVIEDEAKAREAADSALQNRIEQEAEERQTALETETAARQTEDDKLQSLLNSHKSDKSNPHGVTRVQVGLGNVDNTSDLNKPISTATQAAIDAETSARETAISNVETAIAQKAAKTEVLTKTNTTAFTPSSNYQPATKKYVDDSVSAAGGGDMLKSVYDTDNSGTVDDSDKLGGQAPSYYATASAVTAKANTSAVLTKTNTTSFTPTSNYHPATKKYVDDSVSGKANTSAVLTKTNTTSFTPTSNYHPATKKYVDDSVAGMAVFPEKPDLTALTPEGTLIGAVGWTGTGEFRVANQSTDKLYHDDDLTGFKRINLKLAQGENWREWSAFYDFNGVEYEFYYSETRGVYETLLPAGGKTVAQIVSGVRWVYKSKPRTIHYGSTAEALAIQITDSSDTANPVKSYRWQQSPSVLSQIGCSRKLIEDDLEVIRVYSRDELDFSELPVKHRIKLYLVADTRGEMSVGVLGLSEIVRAMNGGVLIAIEKIDNWTE